MPDIQTKFLDLAYFHYKAGRHTAARQLCEEVLVACPENSEALYLLARVAHEGRQFPEAFRCLARLVSGDPDSRWYGDYYQTACAAKAFDESISFFRGRTADNRDDHLAHYYLGSLFLESGDPAQAEASFRTSLALSPRFAGGYAGMAEVLEKGDELFGSLGMWRKAVEAAPTNFTYLSSLAYNLKILGRAHEAVEWYRRAIALAPEDSLLQSYYLLNLLCTERFSPEEVFTEHLRWAEQCARPLEGERRPWANDATPDRPLTVGYVSGDFRCHPVAFFIEPILACHDRSSFRIILYDNGRKPDYITDQFHRMGFEWRDIAQLGDVQVAELVRNDSVDILIDLAGHTLANRLLVFARKPAPVQVTWLGYANTTGLDTIDYRVSDAVADPPGMTEHIHSEALWRLPGSFICYRPPQNPPLVGSPPFKEKGYVTFAVFNHFAKVTPEMMALWEQILRDVPESRLIMKSAPLKCPAMRESILERFRLAGIASERIELSGRLPTVLDHLAFFTQVDIALDTYPYNGTTTTCEALFMGVPVITLAGRAHVSRVGASLLTSVGLPELIADSPENYLITARTLARDHVWLEGYRASLREMMTRSPLMDVAGFTRNLEGAYRQMWRRWCEGCQPQAIK